MMTRQLPPTEWDRLLEADHNLRKLPSTDEAVVFVQEDDLGDIIGYWMVLHVVHIEPMWIRPDHRGGLVPRRLWQKVRHFLDNCSILKAFCFTDQPIVGEYLERLGLQELPTRIYEFSCPKTPSPEAAMLGTRSSGATPRSVGTSPPTRTSSAPPATP